LTVTIIAVAWGFVALIDKHSSSPKEEPLRTRTETYVSANAAESIPVVEQISLKDKTKEQAMQAWWARRERDKEADWKIPIRFYGRVVDQNMKPVNGATIHFQWTDLSKQGTSEASTASTSNGNSSLSGMRGK